MSRLQLPGPTEKRTQRVVIHLTLEEEKRLAGLAQAREERQGVTARTLVISAMEMVTGSSAAV